MATKRDIPPIVGCYYRTESDIQNLHAYLVNPHREMRDSFLLLLAQEQSRNMLLS